MRRVFKTKRETIELESRIISVTNIMSLLRDNVRSSKKILNRIQNSDKIKQEFINQKDKLVKNVKNLNKQLHSPSPTAKMLDIGREKLRKLSNLYIYLGKGSAHNFVRSELLKKLVNMNISIGQDIDIKKLELLIKISK